jgi:VanZ family protein
MTFEKIRKIKKQGTIPVVLTAVIGMIYAATDEFHQGFVDGRSPKAMDVCIDTAGTFMGALFIMIIWFLIFGRKRKNVAK